MPLFRELIHDDFGGVLTAELVLLGTLGVVGATVGLGTVATALNEELNDLALGIRSLDQSYCVPGHSGCGAWTAGSHYQQEDVEISLNRLRKQAAQDERQLQERFETLRERGPEPTPVEPDGPNAEPPPDVQNAQPRQQRPPVRAPEA